MSAPPTDSVRRVLMTTDTVGGVWHYAVELCREFGALGIEVRLATLGAPLRPTQQQQIWKLENVSVSESEFALEWMDDPWSDIARAAEWLWQLGQDFQPDIVHLNHYAHTALPWSAPKIVVAHSCVLSWWQATKGEAAPESWGRYARLVKRGLAEADAVVAPTRWMADELARHYGLERAAVVIPNGRNPRDYIPAAKDPVIVSLGRLWDEAKNVSALTAVAGDLPWSVVIAGDLRSPDGHEKSFPGVKALGFLSEKDTAGWLARASIYAAPARYEPFGLSILEAALSGCALVLGDIPSLHEVWGDAARYVPPEDRAALRATCLELVHASAQREQLAHAARERAQCYTAKKMSEAYLDLYANLIRAARPERVSIS